jgi:hypothetical protein
MTNKDNFHLIEMSQNNFRDCIFIWLGFFEAELKIESFKKKMEKLGGEKSRKRL